MIEKTQDGIKLFGFYRGKVIQHLDGGKCKIFVSDIYPAICESQPKLLPDAEQAAPLFGGINKGNGMFSYPNIDSMVWVFFENGDQNKPVYFASTLGGENPTDSVSDGFKEIRNNVSINEDPKQDTTRNGEDSQQHMITCGDTKITLRETGEVDIVCEDKEAKTYAKIELKESGTIKISATDMVTIDAPVVKVNASSNISMSTTAMDATASSKTFMKSPQFNIDCTDSFSASSPAITMDASKGKFMAKGKTHAPITVV